MAKVTEMLIHGIMTPVIQLGGTAEEVEDPIRAEIAAMEAEESRDVAIEAATNAKVSAERAEAALHKPPIIRDGNWWIWNAERGEYENSGVTATGSDADVTTENIKKALGYNPADEAKTVGVETQTFTDAQKEQARKNIGAVGFGQLPDIVCSAQGEVISLPDASNRELKGLRLFGKTTQDGTPTPDAPVELESVGKSGYIRTMILPPVRTERGESLAGIPVSEGGNYTDENGQQWVCDEVDLDRGVYVQRVKTKVFDGTEVWVGYAVATGAIRFSTYNAIAADFVNVDRLGDFKCSHYPAYNNNITWGGTQGASMGVSYDGSSFYHSFLDLDRQTAENLATFFAEQYAAGTPVTVQYILATPIETPLTGEELAAYAERYGGGGTIYGRTTQDGTPTPDAPVELVNHSDVLQSLTLSTPNGLPGIPVSSGGNYTDKSGQQWICDEVDFGRGVYMKRVKCRSFNGTESEWKLNGPTNAGNYRIGRNDLNDVIDNAVGQIAHTICSHYPTVSGLQTWGGETGVCQYTEYGQHGLWFFDPNIQTVDVWQSFLAEQYAAGTPLEIQYVLAAPIETPLSAEELAAYAALHTNYPNTTVLNDGGAGMEVAYVADTKLYIDNKFAELAAAFVNNA